MAPFSKEDKLVIKNLYECKGYNARQFITVSGKRMDNEKHPQAAGEVENVQNSVTRNFRHFR